MKFIELLLVILFAALALATTPSKYSNYKPPFASTYDMDRQQYKYQKCRTRTGGVRVSCIF